MSKLFILFFGLSIISQFIAAVIGITYSTLNKRLEYRLVTAYLLLGGINESITLYCSYIGYSTQLFNTFYLLIDYLLLSAVFYSLFPKKERLMLIGSVVIFLPLFMFELLDFDMWKINFKYTKIFYFLALVLSSLLQFKVMFNHYLKTPLIKTFEFWFSAGVLTFYSGNLLLTYFISFLAMENQSLLWLIYIQIVCNIIYNFLLAVALTKSHYES